MEHDGGDGSGRRWGAQVLVVLVFGMMLAVLGRFVAAEFGDAIDAPVAATPGPALAAP